MKRVYDIAGFGEGIAGPLACSLLAARGFSCLWIDTSPTDENQKQDIDIPAFITSVAWEKSLKQSIIQVDTRLSEALDRSKKRVQCIIPGRRKDMGPRDSGMSQSALKKYVEAYIKLINSAKTNPFALYKRTLGRPRVMDPCLDTIMKGLSGSFNPGFPGYLRMLASFQGLCTLNRHMFRSMLLDFISETRGECIKAQKPDIVVSNGEAIGLKMSDMIIKARYYLTEGKKEPSKNNKGFLLYGQHIIDTKCIPARMGDILFISPPDGLESPIVLLANVTPGAAKLSYGIKVLYGGKGSDLVLREKIRSASEMVMNRIREVIPFIDDFTIEGFTMDPTDSGDIRPYYAVSLNPERPPIFNKKRFFISAENAFLCDRSKYEWLDVEGELLWGIHSANTVLNAMHRSDLIM